MLPGLLLALSVLGAADARKMMNKAELHARQVEAAKRFDHTTRALPAAKVKNITFSNPKASGARVCVRALLNSALSWCPLEFYVDGTTIPEVDFDVGPSWSGLMPISANANETRKVRCVASGNQCPPLTVHAGSSSSGSSPPDRREVSMTLSSGAPY